MRDIRHHLASTIGAASERGRSPKITDAVRPGAVQRAARAGFWRRSFPVIYPGRDPRPWPRADHQVSNRAAHIAVGAAVDGLLSTRGIWVQADEGASLTGVACAPNRRDRGVAGRA